MAETDDKPRRLPKKFRASADPKHVAEFLRLQANDEEQKALGERINSPFTSNSPRDVARSKAQITIDTLTASDQELTPDQKEILAEAYAAVGSYDVAAVLSEKNKELYEHYWKAVWLKDDKWCEHSQQDKYIKEYVFSVKEKKEMPMMACNTCGTWNVIDAPDALVVQEKQQTEIGGQTRGMSISDARAWHDRNRRRR